MKYLKIFMNTIMLLPLLLLSLPVQADASFVARIGCFCGERTIRFLPAGATSIHPGTRNTPPTRYELWRDGYLVEDLGSGGWGNQHSTTGEYWLRAIWMGVFAGHELMLADTESLNSLYFEGGPCDMGETAEHGSP